VLQQQMERGPEPEPEQGLEPEQGPRGHELTPASEPEQQDEESEPEPERGWAAPTPAADVGLGRRSRGRLRPYASQTPHRHRPTRRGSCSRGECRVSDRASRWPCNPSASSEVSYQRCTSTQYSAFAQASIILLRKQSQRRRKGSSSAGTARSASPLLVAVVRLQPTVRRLLVSLAHAVQDHLRPLHSVRHPAKTPKSVKSLAESKARSSVISTHASMIEPFICSTSTHTAYPRRLRESLMRSIVGCISHSYDSIT